MRAFHFFDSHSTLSFLSMNIRNIYSSSSSYERSLEQLSDDIDFVYKDLTSYDESYMSLHQLSNIQYKILNCTYIPEPLRVKLVNKDEISQFMNQTLPVFSEFTLGIVNDDLYKVVIPSNKEDNLVLMALSLMLLRLTYGGIPKEGYRIENRTVFFISSIQEMKNVDRLYLINLGSSLSKIPKSFILEKILSLVGEGPVYNLLLSFVDLPIIDDDGIDRKEEIRCGAFPVAGEICRVLLNIVLMDIFDREFTQRFPGIAFSRYVTDVFIASRSSDDSLLINEKELFKFLKEVNLSGIIQSTGRDKFQLMATNVVALVDSDGQVHAFNKKKKVFTDYNQS